MLVDGQSAEKGVGHFQPQRMTDVYTAIDQIIVAANGFAMTAVCDLLQISRSAHYAWGDELRIPRADHGLRLAQDRRLGTGRVDG